ncbi:MAG: lamin tail domain-containing protein, partial [Bacteroidales bacterium]|nr:lamin tail domain-containing protein [Bacteroidales bacterium]
MSETTTTKELYGLYVRRFGDCQRTPYQAEYYRKWLDLLKASASNEEAEEKSKENGLYTGGAAAVAKDRIISHRQAAETLGWTDVVELCDDIIRKIEADPYYVFTHSGLWADLQAAKNGWIRTIDGFQRLFVDFMEYDASIGKGSWIADGACATPTPGFPNTLSGLAEYNESLTLPQLYISEVMSSNKKYMPQDGKYYDWVELCNGGDTPLRLSDYYLTDKYSELARYKLPDKELPAGGYIVTATYPGSVVSDAKELTVNDNVTDFDFTLDYYESGNVYY